MNAPKLFLNRGLIITSVLIAFALISAYYAGQYYVLHSNTDFVSMPPGLIRMYSTQIAREHRKCSSWTLGLESKGISSGYIKNVNQRLKMYHFLMVIKDEKYIQSYFKEYFVLKAKDLGNDAELCYESTILEEYSGNDFATLKERYKEACK